MPTRNWRCLRRTKLKTRSTPKGVGKRFRYAMQIIRTVKTENDMHRFDGLHYKRLKRPGRRVSGVAERQVAAGNDLLRRRAEREGPNPEDIESL